MNLYLQLSMIVTSWGGATTPINDIIENLTTDLFSELASPQKDASGAGTRDSLISCCSSSELRSDERRNSEDLGGERGGRVEKGEWGIPVQNILLAI